jgi:hypothetical protein
MICEDEAILLQAVYINPDQPEKVVYIFKAHQWLSQSGLPGKFCTGRIETNWY